jgi:hypothetical protein
VTRLNRMRFLLPRGGNRSIGVGRCRKHLAICLFRSIGRTVPNGLCRGQDVSESRRVCGEVRERRCEVAKSQVPREHLHEDITEGHRQRLVSPRIQLLELKSRSLPVHPPAPHTPTLNGHGEVHLVQRRAAVHPGIGWIRLPPARLRLEQRLA